MKNKSVTWAVLAIAVILLLAAFLPRLLMEHTNSMKEALENIYQAAQADEWTKAEKYAAELMQNWDKQRLILAFNYAEEDYATFQHTIIRVENAVKNEEKNEAMAEADVAINLLTQNFDRLMPEP